MARLADWRMQWRGCVMKRPRNISPQQLQRAEKRLQVIGRDEALRCLRTSEPHVHEFLHRLGGEITQVLRTRLSDGELLHLQQSLEWAAMILLQVLYPLRQNSQCSSAKTEVE